MSVLLPMLSLLIPSEAATTAEEFRTELENACFGGPIVRIRLPETLVIDPTMPLVYPTFPDDCPDVLPSLIIEPTPGIPRSELRVEGGTAVHTMLTLQGDAIVTLRNLDWKGPRTGDPGTFTLDGISEPEADTPECAALGGSVRAVGMFANGFGRLTVEDSTFTCFDAAADALFDGSGGAIHAEGTVVQITGGAFTSNSADDSGGAVSVTGDTFTSFNGSLSTRVTDATFTTNNASTGGAVHVDWSGMNASFTTSVFDGNHAASGGALDLVSLRDGLVRDSLFTGAAPMSAAEGDHGGAVRFDGSPLYDLTTPPSLTQRGEFAFYRNRVCGQQSGKGGALYVNSVPDLTIQNNLFAGNEAPFGGGALFLETARAVAPEQLVHHNLFVGNAAGRLSDGTVLDATAGAAVKLLDGELIFRNNVVTQSMFGGGVTGSVVTPGSTVGLTHHSNLWFDNGADLQGDLANLALGQFDVTTDPLLTWTPGDCSVESFQFHVDSPVVDAGGGELSSGLVPGPCEDWSDVDLPPDGLADGPITGDPNCDIGPFGGERALRAADTDLDGFTEAWDCANDDPTHSPATPEVCNGLDEDCDGEADDGLAFWLYFNDDDNDGFGGSSDGLLYCAPPVPGTIIQGGDCDDSNPLRNPNQAEVCNGLDDDCIGLADDGLAFLPYFDDDDGDGYGGATDSQTYCAAPFPGQITQGGDCDDVDDTINPGASEVCNTVDDNCDGQADEGLLTATYYPDVDGDGEGDPTAGVTTCGPAPEGFVTEGSDCDDTDPIVNTLAQERCGNTLDDDCDGAVDEADANTANRITVYPDNDGDGFGAGAEQLICGPVPDGLSESGFDCDDTDAAVVECQEGSCGGCSAGTGPSSLGLALVPLLLLLRRRG